MTETARPEDFRLLGLSPEASAEEAERAYHRMKALYSEGSLATYALLDEVERAEMQNAVEKAYLRVSVQIRERDSLALSVAQAAVPESEHAQAQAPAEAKTDADESFSVGEVLRHHREKLGLTLKDVSNRTRIRSTHLDNIEKERFDELPAPVYLRGFVLEFAKALGLHDPETMVVRYLQRCSDKARK